MEYHEAVNEARAIVNRLDFVFAKTMPRIPHEYVVRNEGNQSDYVRLFHLIQDYGYDSSFYSKTYRYLNVDGYKYWIMTDKEEDSRIINRAVV